MTANYDLLAIFKRLDQAVHRPMAGPGEPVDKAIGPLQGRALDKIEEARVLLAEAGGLLRAANAENGVWQSTRWKNASDEAEKLLWSVEGQLIALTKAVVDLPPEDGGPYGVFGRRDDK